jgi:GNAT superfamily N-acetyltransferase
MSDTTGEPRIFSDLALSRRLERAEARAGAEFVETKTKLFPSSKAQWIEVAGAYAMYDGVQSPVTQTFGLGLFETVRSAEIKTIEEFYQEFDSPVFHEVSPLADTSLTALLAERHYHPMEFTSVMFHPLRPGIHLPVPVSEQIQVRQIQDGEHELFAQTSAKGWADELPGLADTIIELAQVHAQRPDALSFLAELDGQPVATGALCICDGVALLAGASTVPEWRRNGAQLALLDARLNYAAEHGCDLAMICALPGGASQRNAERNGFRIAYTRIKWQLTQKTE